MITSIIPDDAGRLRLAFCAVCGFCLRVIECDPAIVTNAGTFLHPLRAVAWRALTPWQEQSCSARSCNQWRQLTCRNQEEN
jgi:hypothetical protein